MPKMVSRKPRQEPKKKRCRHTWSLKSHNDFKDGEYEVCTKCRKVKFS